MTRDMERTELIARESIRDLLARYTWAGDRGRTAELADLFTADGVLDVGSHGGRWEGRETIAAELEAVTTRVAAAGGSPGPVHHHVSSIHIHLDTPASAVVRSYFLVVTAIGPDHWGRYRDQVVESAADGGWRFAERTVRVDGHAPGTLMVRDPEADADAAAPEPA